MQADTHLTPDRPQTCSNIPKQQYNLTSNMPGCNRLQSLNLSFTLHPQESVKHTSNYCELGTLLLILHMVQGTFNQQKLQLENNLPSLCRHKLAKRGANLLLCMDLRKIMKQQKCNASNCSHHTLWLTRPCTF